MAHPEFLCRICIALIDIFSYLLVEGLTALSECLHALSQGSLFLFVKQGFSYITRCIPLHLFQELLLSRYFPFRLSYRHQIFILHRTYQITIDILNFSQLAISYFFAHLHELLMSALC